MTRAARDCLTESVNDTVLQFARWHDDLTLEDVMLALQDATKDAPDMFAKGRAQGGNETEGAPV